MLRFFRSSGSIVFVVIILTGGVTWLHALSGYEPTHSGQYGAFLFFEIAGWLTGMPVLSVWCGLVLLLTVAMLLIFANNRLRLIDKISYLPALCYVLLVGGVTELHRFNPALIATILLIAAFVLLVGSFKSERLSYNFFTVSALISTATFFYQYMYMYMLVVWLSILLWRPGYWREWVFSILGFAFPLFLAFSWFFLMADDYARMGVFLSEIFTFQRITISLSVTTIVFSTASLLMVIITFGHLMRYLGSKKVIVRNGYYILILMAVITIVLTILLPDTFPFAWYLLAFPMSFILSNYLATVKSARWGTIVLSLLFTGVAVVQIIFLFAG